MQVPGSGAERFDIIDGSQHHDRRACAWLRPWWMDLALDGRETDRRAQTRFFVAVPSFLPVSLLSYIAQHHRPSVVAPACTVLDSSTSSTGDLDHQAGHAKAGESQRQVPSLDGRNGAAVSALDGPLPHAQHRSAITHGCISTASDVARLSSQHSGGAASLVLPCNRCTASPPAPSPIAHRPLPARRQPCRLQPTASPRAATTLR